MAGLEGYPIINGLSFPGVVASVVSTSPMVIETNLKGFRDAFFQDCYLNVVCQSAGKGAAPQGDYILCTAYTGVNGYMTLQRPPNGGPFTPNDQIYMLQPCLVGGLNIVTQPSTQVKQQDNTEVHTNAVSPGVPLKTLNFSGSSGGCRISFQLKVVGGGSATARVQSGGYDSPFTVISSTYQTQTVDFYGLLLNTPITIVVYVDNPAHTAYLKNFTIGYDIVSLPITEITEDTVYVDNTSLFTGFDWPNGAPGQSVNTIDTGLIIARKRLEPKLRLQGSNIDYVADNADIFDNLEVNGSGPDTTYLALGDFTAMVSVGNATFRNIRVQGWIGYITPPQPVNFIGCNLINIECGTTLVTYNCFFHYLLPDVDFAMFETQTIDGRLDLKAAGSPGGTLSGLKGDLTLYNMADVAKVLTIYANGLQLTIDSSCTDGTINIYGNANVINNGGASLVVNDKTIQNQINNTMPLPVARTIDLNQAAGDYNILTGTSQACLLKSLTVHMPDAAAGGALTAISVQTDDTTPQVIISQVQGAVANLTAENQLAWDEASSGSHLYQDWRAYCGDYLWRSRPVSPMSAMW